MIKSELKDYLKNTIFSDKGKLKYSTINKLDEYIKNIIYEATLFLNDADINERIYYILNDITTTIICPCCKNNKPNFISISSGYFGTCSVKCSTKFSSKKVYDTKIQNNSFINASIANKKTKLLKYGDENYNNTKKQQETMLDMYGVNTALKIPEKRNAEKAKQTCLEKYGVEFPLLNSDIQQKSLMTKLIKYSNDRYVNPQKHSETKQGFTEIQWKGIHNKRLDTIEDKYGDRGYINIDKRDLTCLEKYGVKNISQANIDTNSGYKWKEYITPDNNILKIQGFENYLLDELLLEYKEDEIITSRKYIPEIWYTGLDGKKHRYFPDVYVPSTNTIYEVKSEYTLNVNKEINKLKFQAVKDAGYNFILKVY